MTARRYALLAALALFVMFIAANVTGTTWFRSWRLDLTENQLYSISRGTQQTLDELTEPITLTLYFSRDAAAERPDLVAYAGRVREMLQTYAARSRGRVRFVQVDVAAFSDEEDEALEVGIEPVRLYEGADPIYFGIVGVNAIDERQLLPLLDPAQEPTLEYLVTRLIWGLENPDRTRVALITSLPIDPPTDPRMMTPGAQSTFAIEMGRFFEVTKLAPDFAEIPDVDVLAIIHPGALSERQLYAIDQFVLRRGRAFVALDPASMASMQEQSFDPFDGAQSSVPQASTLEPLLARWGVIMQPTVVLDGQFALPVQVQDPNTGAPGQAPQPLFFTVPREGLDSNDLMTSWLRRGINFGLAGGLSWSEREGVEVTQLVQTSGQTMRLPAQTALMRPSPYDIAAMWPPAAGRIETIAVRVAGNIESAFPDGRPAAEAAPPALADGDVDASPAAPVEEAATVAHLARSEASAQIVVVADTDFLDDAFYVDPSSGGAAMDNASFVINAIEVLSGSDALVSLRSRAAPARRMELLDDMEEDADRQIRDRQEELQIELQQAEQRLAEVQARSGGGAFSGNLGAEMTPEETAVVEGFRQEVLRARTELRGVERTLRADINNLEALLVFINVWLAPLLIAGAGMFLFWRRQRRGRGRS